MLHVKLFAETQGYIRLNQLLLNELAQTLEPFYFDYLPKWPPEEKEFMTPYTGIKMVVDKDGKWDYAECECHIEYDSCDSEGSASSSSSCTSWGYTATHLTKPKTTTKKVSPK